MSILIEQRMVNDISVPLYFKFGTISTKCNLTVDKLITFGNWLDIFDELNPLLISQPSNSSSHEFKTFDLDNGRLTFKANWMEISDSSDVGCYIGKILNLSSSKNVGKYFLKIDVELGSHLERIVSELEQKNKPTNDDAKSKSTQPSQHSQKSKRKLPSKPENQSKKMKLKDVHSSQVGDSSIRNLMTEPVQNILATYPEHEKYLTGLYKTHITTLKRNYEREDLPKLTALFILSEEQFTKMISFLERKLVRDDEAEHNCTDVIFDLIIPEWALAIFSKKFEYTRQQALERLRLQSSFATPSSVCC